MKKLLFIGGTRFFGKEVVMQLMQKGECEVTILSRGNSIPSEFMRYARFICCDRSDAKAVEAALRGKEFDVVVDNIAYMGGGDVKAVLDVLHGRVGHYLLCSSGAVYPSFGFHEWKESEANLEPLSGQREYANNKREAEKKLFTYSNVPYTVYRPTVVQGAGDFTRRPHYFVEKILLQQEFYIPDDVILKHLYVEDLIYALLQLIDLVPENKIYNICGDDKVSLEEYCERIARIVNKKPCQLVISREEFIAKELKDFPSAYDRSLLLSNDAFKQRVSFAPKKIDEWLPIVVRSNMEEFHD